MRITFTILLSLFCLQILHAQSCASDRYLKSTFAVDTLQDVVYGNAPAITAVYIAENVTTNEALMMDIYLPAGDTLTKRPCLVFAFGGGFLIGGKEDEDARSTCDSLARKGYVAASIKYRLNLNVASNASGERAAYRGMQDFSSAIRYLKEKADSFGIDTNYIFSGGVSAGGISAMGAAYMIDADRPATTFANNVPPRPDLGCLDCSGNNYLHSRRVRAVINCWGAVQDTLIFQTGITADSVPLAMFHGALDPVVPFNYGLPFTALLTLSPVYGSNLIHTRRQNLGLHSELHVFPTSGHNVWGTVINNNFVPGPTQHWNPITNDIRDFLYQWLIPPLKPISGSTTAWVGATRTYTVPSSPGSQYCWWADGGHVISQNGNSVDILWDSTGIREVYVQEINHLLVPGDTAAYNVFVGAVGVEEAIDHALEIFPNPVSEFLTFKTKLQGEFQYAILSLNGKTLKSGKLLISQDDNPIFDLSDLPGGVYIFQGTINGKRLSGTRFSIIRN